MVTSAANRAIHQLGFGNSVVLRQKESRRHHDDAATAGQCCHPPDHVGQDVHRESCVAIAVIQLTLRFRSGCRLRQGSRLARRSARRRRIAGCVLLLGSLQCLSVVVIDDEIGLVITDIGTIVQSIDRRASGRMRFKASCSLSRLPVNSPMIRPDVVNRAAREPGSSDVISC